MQLICRIQKSFDILLSSRQNKKKPEPLTVPALDAHDFGMVLNCDFNMLCGATDSIRLISFMDFCEN